MSYPRCCTTRNRLASGGEVLPLAPPPAGGPRPGRWLLLLSALLLALSGGPVASAQPAAGADSVARPVTAPVASGWSTAWAVLGGVALGALGVWLWVRKSPPVSVPPAPAAAPPAPEPAQKKPAENVRRTPVEPPPAEPASKGVSVQSLREVQETTPKRSARPPGKDKKTTPNFNSRSTPPAKPVEAWPAISPRPATMNPSPPPVPPAAPEPPLETGQTVEWTTPAPTLPAIQELIDASTPTTPGADEAATPPAAPGPVHYYAPAPDVPSIEHRKLSPNPLPQMPLLVTLPHVEATTAQFSFSPQADQSRIIGNGVRELKEFFQFELPPTEQFTVITNLTAGQLEKRDDAWHVVQKATIALS